MSNGSATSYPLIFEQERTRLLAALGAITAGGVVENIQPVGSSSVPGLASSGKLDIGLSVWPYPVDTVLLARLGYHPVSGFEPEAQGIPRMQRFEDASGQVQLWLASADSGFLEHALLIRDYLRDVEAARQDFAANRTVKAAFFTRILPHAQRWWVTRHGFSPLETIAAEFMDRRDFRLSAAESDPAVFPWYISSGWAIDLFLGRVTRVHRDVDVVVPFSHQLVLQSYLVERGWQLLTALDGHLEPWPRHMQIHLPRHQIHAHRDEAFIDLLLAEIEHGVWRYRRNPVVLRNADRIGMKSPGGIPYLAPEIVLLFKSKNTGAGERPQDQADFEQTLPLLEPERRAWLRWAITASDPGHAWLKVI